MISLTYPSTSHWSLFLPLLTRSKVSTIIISPLYQDDHVNNTSGGSFYISLKSSATPSLLSDNEVTMLFILNNAAHANAALLDLVSFCSAQNASFIHVQDYAYNKNLTSMQKCIHLIPENRSSSRQVDWASTEQGSVREVRVIGTPLHATGITLSLKQSYSLFTRTSSSEDAMVSSSKQ